MVLGHHWRRSSGPLGLFSSLWCSTAAVSECQHTQGQDGALESSCFAAGEGGWSAFLFIPLTAGPQSSTSCSWTDPAWKDVAGICPKANLSQTQLDVAAALQGPTRRHPVVAASGQPSTAHCPEPGVSLMPVERGQRACRTMLFGFGRLRHLVCSPSLLKKLCKASTSNGKENKPPSSWRAPSVPFPLSGDRKGSTF